MAAGPWKGTAQSLHEAFEKAAEQADEGEHPVTIYVTVHHNEEGETGPNPIRDYIVVLGVGGG
jgi:hypothetical protein